MEQHNSRWQWWHALAGIIISVAGLMLAPMIVDVFYQDSAASVANNEPTIAGMWANALQFVLYVILGIAITAPLLRRLNAADYGLTLRRPGRIAIAAIGGFLLFTLLSFMFEKLAPGAPEASKQVTKDMELGYSVVRDYLMILSVSVLAPFGEEFLFRGLIFRPLYDGLRKISWLQRVRAWLPFAVATAISAQFFMDSHGGGGQETQMIMFFVMGVIACAAYAWSGSIIAPIMIHSLNNSFVLAHLLSEAPLEQRLLCYAGPLIAFTLAWLLMKAMPGQRERERDWG